MQGRRIESPFASDGGLIDKWPAPGDFYFYPDVGWCAVAPNGVMCNLSAHDVVEHDDHTITVAPSILVRSPTWHGYLERGVWREV